MGSGSGAVVWREIASSPPPGFGRPTGSAGGTASGSERPSPAPGFGAARPSSAQSGGSKSAARTDMLVDVGMEAGSDNLEVPPHVGNESASPTKGTKRKFVVDATEGASPGVNTSNTGQHQHSRRKGKGPGKHAKLEDNKGATKLGRDQTPIGVFEDECVFCHSFRTSEPDELSSPTMESDTLSPVLQNHSSQCPAKEISVDYQMEDEHINPLPCDEMSSPVIESDINSAVLQNHSSQCPAKEISVDCQMEDEHINPLPGDEMSSPIIETDITSAVLQNHSSQCPAKEISGDCQMENEHISPLATSSSSLPGQVPGQYLVKGGTSVLDRREDLQVDQLNTSSSSLPQGQCSDRGRISANHRREEKLVNQSSTPVDQWVLLGISLSASEKDSLKEFASLTSSTLAEEWDKTVTHVIVGRNAGDACGRSYEVLMAILSGKWVVTAGWIVDCMVEPIPDLKTCLEKPIPGPEISYEMNFCDGSCTSGYGPTKGRARAAERAPKLFSGLHFCLSAYIDPEDRETIRRLVAAGGGQVLEGISPDRLHENLNKNPAEVYFIYDSGPPRKITSDFDLILGKEIQESIEYAKSGVQVISHTRLLDAILCYDARILERRLQQDV
ncbi:hypothetical protein CFC21_003123 [Triticum aestivum]|nr:hypothetical protein CFC21_003123 [Triticum aestivum]